MSGSPSGEQPTPRVTYSAADSVGRITLAHPQKRNALSPETIRQLRAALEAAGSDDSVRAVLLVAEGPDFSAGADLDSLAQLVDAPDEVHRADARAFADLFLTMRRLPKPVIAVVQGRALAGGAGLVTACDIALAAEDAAFGYPEVKIGFVAAVVMALLRSSVGEKAAFDLLATGRQITAAEALSIGLVTRVVPAGELDPAARRLAKELAALPPEAVTRTKGLFYECAGQSLEAAFERGVEANVAARSTVAFRQGLSGFLARRKDTQ